MNKGRQWLTVFFTVVVLGIVLFMGTNYYVDPVGYFSAERGAESVNANGYTRAAKSKYMKKHAGEYNAVVLGGSKSGVLSTELLSRYSGKNYYNFYIAYGCFSDYLTYARYLIETAGIEEITLHLSSIEVQYFTKENVNEIYKVPAVINGSIADCILENLNYLCRNITSSIDYVMDENAAGERGMDSLETGERNYSYAYSLMEEDSEAYIQKYVLPRFDKSLKSLFSKKKPEGKAIEENLQAMQEIHDLCQANGVKLNVVIGPTFLAEMYKFEGESYYDYLRKMTAITDVWDFSGFHEVDLNPYNFVNDGHYKNEVADLLVKTMYGEESLEGFGVLLTGDNIEEYLAQRKADFKRLKKEYKKTGTVALGTKEDSSHIA